MNDFGDFLRDARRKAGFRRQIGLSKATGISAATICRLENGNQKPDADTLVALSSALQLSIDELMKAAGYVAREEAPVKTNSCHENELRRLQEENARLREEIQSLRCIIKNLTKGW